MTALSKIPEPTARQDVVRQSNFELLRILAMIFITAAHWGHGLTGVDYAGYSDFNLSFYHVFRGFGQVGVDLYVLISGYFLCKSRFKIQSFLRVVLQVFFTSCLIVAISHVAFPEDEWSPGWIAAYTLLLARGDFWFVEPYLVMFLLSPIINFILNRLDRLRFLWLLVIMAVSMSVFPSVADHQIWSNMVYKNIHHFIFLYVIGAYFRFFHEKTEFGRYAGWESALFFAVFLVLMIMPSVMRSNFRVATYFQSRSNYLTIGFSVFLFLVFKEIKIKPSKIVNAIGASTFGVYLFHENCLTRKRLWSGLFHIEKYIGSEWFALYSIAITLLVFVICSVTDMGRKRFIEKPLFKFLNKKFGKIFDKINDKLTFKKPAVSPETRLKTRYFRVHVIYFATAITLSVVLPYDSLTTFLCAMTVYAAILFSVWRFSSLKASEHFLK